ncbi:MATE efflux family protein [Thiorhodovibrio litoralis]|nr:MATE efflux family protein [Thiorhodovibrio litoralis]
MLISAVMLFALYRYINEALGTATLGIWSVVLATASASRIVDLGVSASVTRFVAKDLARNRPDGAALATETALLSLVAVLVVALPMLYFPLASMLSVLFEGFEKEKAILILPYALISLFLTIVASIFQSGLDGCQRMELRAGVVLVGQTVMLALAFWLVPELGLLGLAWAQIGQGAFLAVAGWLLLRGELSCLSCLPHRWSWPKLREMLSYGINLQIATVFILLADPLAKALIVHFGNSTAAGTFEMANQVVLKVRALVVAANKAVIPRIAELVENSPEALDSYYRVNMQILALSAIPVFAFLQVWSGTVSWLLLGCVDQFFLFAFQLTCLGWFINIFSGPAYFANMGTGEVGWNTISHIVTAAVTTSMGWSLGRTFGAEGVLWAYAAGLTAGTLWLIITHQRRKRIKLGDLDLAGTGLVPLTGVFAVLAASLMWGGSIHGDGNFITAFVVVSCSSFLVVAVAWINPIRDQLWFQAKTQLTRDSS